MEIMAGQRRSDSIKFKPEDTIFVRITSQFEEDLQEIQTRVTFLLITDGPSN